jgi:diaminohydroxyphosphoribosylaminopyrimidine deaminase/5-amino-6-(5-phosphoribosylamino)uracil reductase
MGTVLADDPQLNARDVGADRQPRRLAFGRGPLPDGSELELLGGPLEDELERLGSESVQSLLLEGGPRLATSFLGSDLVDKLLLVVAPTIAGEGPFLLGKLARQVRLTRLETGIVGEDVLLAAYLHEP